MTHFSHLPLQKAVYDVLTADATLMALITGLYDHVPQDTPYPYIFFGDVRVDDISNLSTQQMDIRLPFYIMSRQAGRAQTATIMDRVHFLLHEAALMPVGQILVSLRDVSNRITLQSDGFTYEGEMIFRALLQAE